MLPIVALTARRLRDSFNHVTLQHSQALQRERFARPAQGTRAALGTELDRKSKRGRTRMRRAKAERTARERSARTRRPGLISGSAHQRGRQRSRRRVPEETARVAPGPQPWLTGRRGLSGSAEPTPAIAMTPRSGLLNPRLRGSRRPRALQRKGRPVAWAARR